jgi:hypothetical protein
MDLKKEVIEILRMLERGERSEPIVRKLEFATFLARGKAEKEFRTNLEDARKIGFRTSFPF